jgi:DNA helicase II / ATP-dependent DNA helicase PcrA
LVDEFQDTNYAQYQLIKLLSAKNKNLTVVGDDDQSIYKFRGASVSNILKFKNEDYPQARQITLVKNYRSAQNILDLAYNFIQSNNPDRLEFKLHIDKKLESCERQPGTIEVLEGKDLSEELNFIVKKILQLKSQKANGQEPISWKDFAILIRANSAADELLPILSAAGIPYTFMANRGLYKKPIVLDVLSYMRVLDNSNDSISLYRIFSLPKFQLSYQDLSLLLLYGKKKTRSLYDSLLAAQTLPEISSEAKTKIRELIELLQKHSSQAKTATAAEMLVAIANSLGLGSKITEQTQDGVESRELLEQFYKYTEEFEKQNEHKDLHSFLQYLSLEMQAGGEGNIKFDPNQGPESLTVSTIHSAKGLEFKYVFIINLVEQRFPTREKGEAIEVPTPLINDILPEGDFHLQEERRLFYVALTRAKAGLYLTWAKDYGGARLKKPSLFLQETALVPSDKENLATGKVFFTTAEKKPSKKRFLENCR